MGIVTTIRQPAELAMATVEQVSTTYNLLLLLLLLLSLVTDLPGTSLEPAATLSAQASRFTLQ
jgi:hypothetical protein